MVFRLKKGDLIDVLAPGSFIDEDENFQKGIEILKNWGLEINENNSCLLYTSPSPRDRVRSRMPSSA